MLQVNYRIFNAFKKSLEKVRNNRMGFILDQFTEP